MRSWTRGAFLLTCLLMAVLSAPPAFATTLLQMNLEQLCERADKIFRGTVLGIAEGTIEAGGGKIPVLTYTLRVDESFKGDYRTVNGVRIAEMRMLGKPLPAKSGNLRRLPLLRDLPVLEQGRSYLLLATRPSASGLSAPVGLGQGCFQVMGRPGEEQALNELGNRGLFRGSDALTGGIKAARSEHSQELPSEGPISYKRLAAEIRAVVGTR